MSETKVALADAVVARRNEILDAAAHCFVLHGFHRATMQDLARMAGMSVGNLYRYFSGKDAVVLALAERDRLEAARDLCEGESGLWPRLARLIRRHLTEVAREKAVLLVEVWAEGTRNPTIAAMLTRFEAENQAWIAEALRSTAPLTPREIQDLVDRIRIESHGISVARALSPDYDPAPATERLIGAVEAKLAQAAQRGRGTASRLEAVA